MAFTMVVAVTFGAITTQRLHGQLITEYKRRASLYAQHGAEEVLGSLLLETGRDRPLLARNLLSRDMIYVQIVIDGEIKAQQSRLNLDLPLMQDLDNVRIKEVHPADNFAAYLDIAQPLGRGIGTLTRLDRLISPEGQKRLQQGITGYVRLGLSLESMEQKVRQEALLLTGLSLGLMALGILCGWILYLMILKPLEILSNTVREFGAGNVYARARVKSGDEIETLSHEFNTMAGSIIYQRDALRKTNEELEKANRVKSTFLAMISHELRTPTHSVLGYASLLLDEVNVKLNDAGRQYTKAIRRAGKHLMALIENLIEFSKLESGTEQLYPTLLTVNDIVDEVVENQQPLAEKKALSLTTAVQPEVPVIFLTARDSADDAIKGLSLGGDDYLTKPFEPRELEARMHAVMRRLNAQDVPDELQVGALHIDDRTKTVNLNGKAIHLAPKEFELLKLLASDAGRVFSDQEIVESLWPPESLATSNDVKQYVHLLRHKIEHHPQRPSLILTVKGFGYKLAA